MRRALEALCRLVVRIFFRRVEVVGEEGLPDGGLLLTPNHPNALVDPLFVVTQSPRPVSFLAKAPLFSTFLVRHFVRGFDCLPVYRAQDGFDTSKNRETLTAAGRVLTGGGAIAIFPEGKSHHEPQLAPLKTGAARIALGGRASAGAAGAAVHVVPCGIFYVDKGTFRSDAALVYGPAIPVPFVDLDEDAEPPRAAVEELTEAIRSGLNDLLVQGESHDIVRLAALTSRLVQGARGDRGEAALPELGAPEHAGRLERERRFRRRVIEGYERLTAADTERLASMVERLTRLDALYRHYGIDPAAPSKPMRAGPAARALLGLSALVLLAPLGLVGAALSYPVYRFVGWLARRAAKGAEDVVATMKVLGGLLFFPAWWLALALAGGALVSWAHGLALLLALPVSAYVALRLTETLPEVAVWLRTIALRVSRADVHRALTAERGALYDALLALSDELDGSAASPA